MSNSGTSTKLNLTVATRSKGSPTVRVQAPIPQQGTLGPAIKTFENVVVSNMGKKGGYVLWAGSVDIGLNTTGALSVSVLDGKGSVVDVAFF